MTASCRTVSLFLFLGSICGLLSGCSLGTFSEPSTASSMLPQISGQVHGGQQAISSATIQLYAANTTVSKGPSSPLLTATVMTDANGGFTLTGDYKCPTPASLVYIVATGGDPGLPGNVNNSDIALMAVLGTCGSLTNSTYIVINELTTVAAVEALAPFMTDLADIGSANASALAGAFATAAALVNFSTGQIQPPGNGVVPPAQLLNTIANILAACVNSPGGAAGDPSNCGQLLLDAANGATTDTISAMLHIAQLPAQNVANLFALAGAVAPFQPALAAAPMDFSAPVAIALPPSNSRGGRYLLAIDTSQHIWVYADIAAYDPATGLYDIPASTITIYDNNGAVLHTISPGSGGMTEVGQLAADPFGNVWTVNATLTVSKFDSNGNALSPAGGWPAPYVPPPGSSPPTSYPLGISYMSIDPSGNAWGIGSGSNINCFIEANNAGAIITPAGNFCGTVDNTGAGAVSADGSGDVWLLGTNSVAKMNGLGAYLASGVNTNGCFDLNTAGSAENLTFNLAYDRVHNQLWGASNVDIGALHSDGTQVFCDHNGANLPVILPSVIQMTSGNTVVQTVSYEVINSIAVDGAGNLWFTSGGESAVTTGTVVGPPGTPPVITSTVTNYSGLNELDPTGKLITPFNINSGQYGLQTLYNLIGENMAIDAYGNIWIISSANSALYKIPGLAVPKNYQ